jgi:hypothetical protein
MRRVWVTLVVLGLIFVVGACGQDAEEGAAADRSTPDRDVRVWAGAICVAFDGWERSAARFGGRLQEEIETRPSPREGKQVLRKFLDSMLLATRDFIDEVDAAGSPPIGEGEAVAKTLSDGIKRALGALLKARAQVESLSTGDRSRFVAATGRLNHVVGSAVTEIETTIDTINREFDTPELGTAFDSAPECR